MLSCDAGGLRMDPMDEQKLFVRFLTMIPLDWEPRFDLGHGHHHICSRRWAGVRGGGGGGRSTAVFCVLIRAGSLKDD
jgi:hypothetical protein